MEFHDDAIGVSVQFFGSYKFHRNGGAGRRGAQVRLQGGLANPRCSGTSAILRCNGAAGTGNEEQGDEKEEKGTSRRKQGEAETGPAPMSYRVGHTNQ